MDEAENTVRKQMQNRKGVETFVVSARMSVYNKLFGLNPNTAYRSPILPQQTPAESSDGTVDLGVFNKPKEQGQQR